MRIAISGSSGFVGTALRTSLVQDGHEVLRLVRRAPAGPDEVRWDPVVGDIDPAPLEGLDAAVNLAGAGVGDRRWTKAYKTELRQSRVRATTLFAQTLAGLDAPPRVFVSASAQGIYGADREDEYLDEDSTTGQDFLARMCLDWEAATAPARDADIAVCHPRFGLIMGASGGAFKRLHTLARLGILGPLAGGHQFWSHISLTDTVRALRFLIEQSGCVGAFNITAPEPVSNAEFIRVLAHAIDRPAILPAPYFGLRIVLGEYAKYVAGSLRVVPNRLVQSGFRHEHPDARSVVAAALSPNTPP
ncbi:TIGR01777 family oxidoreductase [Phytoactinopolyspora mesophila]|uniref:TIGR01777 family protein n=1 Tax=Phytoactinopolyspora mesophila TaxID=2650750 RepID=A0A7K3M2J0_9ACTN|nr:TIGR01777 family oxidoreductase [Phytoactinopolyspora mesophila]NDL57247.1 TIGR01777 family protein [Phytoactinopolyspora mesophila]